MTSFYLTKLYPLSNFDCLYPLQCWSYQQTSKRAMDSFFLSCKTPLWLKGPRSYTQLTVQPRSRRYSVRSSHGHLLVQPWSNIAGLSCGLDRTVRWTRPGPYGSDQAGLWFENFLFTLVSTCQCLPFRKACVNGIFPFKFPESYVGIVQVLRDGCVCQFGRTPPSLTSPLSHTTHNHDNGISGQ
jgi:hypothetical protein